MCICFKESSWVYEKVQKWLKEQCRVHSLLVWILKFYSVFFGYNLLGSKMLVVVMTAADQSLFISFCDAFLHIWKKMYHALFFMLNNWWERNVGLQWKCTSRKRHPFVSFSVYKITLSYKVLSWMWTFCSNFYFSYANLFDISETFKH